MWFQKIPTCILPQGRPLEIALWFQTVSILLHGKSLEIPRGRGILKAKLLEQKRVAKLEFPGVGGERVQNKGSKNIFRKYTFHGGGASLKGETFGRKV